MNMKGRRGFTVIELMIALSISAIMLTSALTVFNGRKSSTEFTQGVYDLQSKVQNYATQVSSKVLPGYQQYTCAVSVATGRPVLTQASGGGETTSENCIYLGQAFQVFQNGTLLYSYPVFGLRTYTDVNGNIQFPSTPATAKAEPALSSVDGSYLLADTYSLLNGLKIVSATVGATESDFLTIYSSLSSNNTSGNQIAVSAAPKTFSASDVSADTLKSCIEGQSCSPIPLNTTTWKLCITNGVKNAQLSVKAASTGISTSLITDGCP
ncbi:MAG: hypothetical protein JWO96_154 [Candidatus Saccharibacteria bacterium]|nr:hypothetical protein [Candidatus Saccharibacteria bacterium]